MDLLRELHRGGATICMVTHDPRFANHADRSIHLFDGRFVEETAEEFVIRADLPGVSQKDVKVNLMGDTLSIRGERKQESENKNGGMHRVERVYGSFERSFRLATPVRGDKVKAQYRDGVLEIRVPKAEEAKVREVEVQVAS